MDLEVAKKEFINYVSNYDTTNFHIKRKLDHSLRVMVISTQIAESLNLNKEDTDLATLIGLLHDIGRFEQRRIYDTFNDSISVDHGDLGVQILQKDNYLRKYIEENSYDEIIYTAIKNHNKFQIEEGLSERENLFCKIIRDADKIDIIYQFTFINYANSIEKANTQKITIDDIQPFIENRLINRVTDLKDVPNEIGHLLNYLGFIFDINYKISFKILKDKNYMNKIVDRYNFEDEQTEMLIEKAKNIVNTFIDNKLKGDS